MALPTFALILVPDSIACPDQITHLESTQDYLLTAQFTQAEIELEQIKESFSCQLPTADGLARYWFLQGMWYHSTGQKEMAGSYLNQAQVSGFWDEQYGIKSWEPLVSTEEGFIISDKIKKGDFYLNQRKSPTYTTVRTGPSLAQWLTPNGEVLDGEVIYTYPNSFHYLSPVNNRWPALKFRNYAKWTAISSAAFASLAVFQNLRIHKAQDLTTLKRAYGFQIGFASITFVSTGLSLGFFAQYQLY